MARFTYTSDLPPQVRGVLDVNLQQVWLDTFNQAMSLTNSEVEAYQAAWFKVFQVAFPGQVASTTDLPQMQPPPPAAPQGASSAAPSPVAAGDRPVFGHWVDLKGAIFDDLNKMTWIQALPIGEYKHPVYGDIKVTPERVLNFATNVKNRVRGTDLDIDYDHKEHSGKAAGWVRDADARADGLWIAVEWTEDAYNSLKKREYRYFSPEFDDEWDHPMTKVKYKDVLFGGGLTNRPFLKNILPINMSEVIRMASGGGGMDPIKEIAKLLGLQEDTDPNQVLGYLKAKLEQQPPGGEGDGEGQGDGGQGGGDGGQQPQPNQPQPQPQPQPQQPQGRAASETSEGLKKLAETNPELAQLLSEREENNKRLAALETANKLAEINMKLTELQSGSNRKFSVPPAVFDEIRSIALSSNTKTTDAIIKVLDGLTKTGMVELGERGGLPPDPNESAVKAFSDRVEALTKDGKMEYVDAVSQIALEDPDLFEEYRYESFSREEV